MKSKYFFSVAAFFSCCLTMGVRAQVAIDETHFPDPAFREYVSENFDTDFDGSLSEEECQAVTEINGGYMDVVSSLQGIEYFPSLRQLYCGWACYEMTSLDVSKNPALTSLNCGSTKITSLDVSQNPALEELDCSYTSLTSLDVSQNPALISLNCNSTEITSLDVSKNPALKELDCSYTSLTSLDVSHNPALTHLGCIGYGYTTPDGGSKGRSLSSRASKRASLENLDLSNNLALEELGCGGHFSLKKLDVSKNTALKWLDCACTSLTSLDVSKNPALEHLACWNTGLEYLDVSKNTALRNLYCDMTGLTSLDLSQNAQLEDLTTSSWCAGLVLDENRAVDLSTIPGLNLDQAVEWTGGTLEGTKLTFGDGSLVKYKYLTGYTGEHPGMDTVEVALAEIAQDMLEISPVNFPDEAFRNYVSQNLDKDGDGSLSREEIMGVRFFAAGPVLDSDLGSDADFGEVVSLQELKYFPALTFLSVYAPKLQHIDLSGNPFLTHCYLFLVPPGEYDIVELEEAEMAGPGLTELDVTQNPELKLLSYMGLSDLKQLDVSHNPQLEDLYFGSTGMTNLDVSHNPRLASMAILCKKLMSLNLSQNPFLYSVGLYKTSLTSLDLSANTELVSFDCESARREVKAEVGGTYDLSRLPGFDVSRASDWKGGSVQGNILTFQDTAVTYQYETRYSGEWAEEVPSTLEFKLVANPDAEEDVASSVSMQTVPFLAYAREGVLYLQGTQGTVEVFNLQGVCVYHGNETSVKLPSQGVYLVRNQGYTRKVLNL